MNTRGEKHLQHVKQGVDLSGIGARMSVVLLWMMLFGMFVWYQQTYDLTIGEMAQLLMVQLTSKWGILFLVIANLIRPLVFFSAPLLAILTGAIFGPIWGAFLSVILMNSGAMVAYGIGRFLGHGVSSFLSTNPLFNDYSTQLRESSFRTVLMMRLLFLPYDLVNYGSGLLRIQPKAFLFATALGSLPGIISFSTFGSSINLSQGFEEVQLNGWVLLASILMILANFGASRTLQAKKKKEELKTQPCLSQ